MYTFKIIQIVFDFHSFCFFWTLTLTFHDDYMIHLYMVELFQILPENQSKFLNAFMLIGQNLKFISLFPEKLIYSLMKCNFCYIYFNQISKNWLQSLKRWWIMLLFDVHIRFTISKKCSNLNSFYKIWNYTPYIIYN